MRLALFPDRAEERENGWHQRLPRVRPGEQTCLLFCYFSRFAQNQRTTSPMVGSDVPHLLVRKRARSHSWSNVTDRVSES